MPYCFPRSFIKFQGHTGQNITDFDPNWAFLDYRPVAAFKSLRFALFPSDMNFYSHNYIGLFIGSWLILDAFNVLGYDMNGFINLTFIIYVPYVI